jgi:hypothetical protein
VGDADAREAREEEEAEEEEGEVEEEAMGVDGTRGKDRMSHSFGWGKTKPWVTKGRRRRSRGSRAGRRLRKGGEGVDMEGRGKTRKGCCWRLCVVIGRTGKASGFEITQMRKSMPWGHGDGAKQEGHGKRSMGGRSGVSLDVLQM